MRIARVVIGVVLALPCAANAQTVPPGYVEIDGSKTPDQIPEHVMWSTGFETIAFLREKGITRHGPLTGLQLSPADRELLLEEVGRFKDRQAECHRAGIRLQTAMKGLEVAKIEKAMKANTLDCRVEMLDSKDRLLGRMSSEGATALATWMLNERLKVKSVIPKSDLEFYRLPR
jgi:hypothetical protein